MLSLLFGFVWKTVDIFELLGQLDLLGLCIGRASSKHQDVRNPPGIHKIKRIKIRARNVQIV